MTAGQEPGGRIAKRSSAGLQGHSYDVPA